MIAHVYMIISYKSCIYIERERETIKLPPNTSPLSRVFFLFLSVEEDCAYVDNWEHKVKNMSEELEASWWRISITNWGVEGGNHHEPKARLLDITIKKLQPQSRYMFRSNKTLDEKIIIIRYIFRFNGISDGKKSKLLQQSLKT